MHKYSWIEKGQANEKLSDFVLELSLSSLLSTMENMVNWTRPKVFEMRLAVSVKWKRKQFSPFSLLGQNKFEWQSFHRRNFVESFECLTPFYDLHQAEKQGGANVAEIFLMK